MAYADWQDPEERLARILGEYLDRQNAGEVISPDEVAAQHPDLAGEILSSLAAVQVVGAGAPARAGPSPVPVAAAGSSAQPLGALGDYQLLREVGRGGMGVVYEAWQGSLERRVALKVLPAGILADSRAVGRFVREAKLAGSLQHANVVPVFGLEVQSSTPFFAMEFVEGETLAQLLRRRGDDVAAWADARHCFDMAEAFAGVAEGLHHAHSKRVIHRDIKPSNLIFDAGGRLRILDFGLARLDGDESLTASGDWVGTPAYMSPEQARVSKVGLDHRTDIYSLGTTLYEAIAGRPPFRGKSREDTLSQIIGRDPPSPRQLNSAVPVDLETIVLKCLRKEPAERYGTAEALGQDLRRFVRKEAIEARPLAAWERTVRRVRRHRVRIAGATLVLVATDANGDGKLDITDAVRILGHLFSGSEPPAPPFPDCGSDATADDLACTTPPCP